MHSDPRQSPYGSNGQMTMMLHNYSFKDNSTGLWNKKIHPVVSEICALKHGQAHIGQMDKTLNNYKSRQFHRTSKVEKPSSSSRDMCSGVGVTKAPFVNFSVSKIFDSVKLPVRLLASHSYLTGVTAAELRQHLSNMNMIYNSYHIFWRCWKITKITEWRKLAYPGPWVTPYGSNGQVTIELHNYRSRQFQRTSNGKNLSTGFRDMHFTKSVLRWYQTLLPLTVFRLNLKFDKNLEFSSLK